MRIIEKNSYLKTWVISNDNCHRYAEFFLGEPIKEPFSYQFKNGQGLKGDSFGRTLFKKEKANRTILLKDKPYLKQFYHSFAKNEIDFSTFKHYLAHGQKWLETILVAENDGEYLFEIATCGSLRIWVDSQLNTTFTPLLRNKLSFKKINLKLKKGANLITMHMDELFERDTYFMASIQYLDDKILQNNLPNINSHDLQILINFLDNIKADLSTINHQVRLVFNQPSSSNFILKAEIVGMPNDNFKSISTNSINIKQNDKEALLPLPANLGSAHYHFILNVSYNEINLNRLFGVNVLPQANEKMAIVNNTLIGRKKLALEFCAKHGMNRTNRLLAILACNNEQEFKPTDEAWDILDSTLKRISLREDCSDFSLVPLLVIYHKFVSKGFPNKIWQRIKSTILGYRYWLDEKGNDVMWFWSENHTLCFHTAQYLAGILFPNDIFTNTGLKGSNQQELGYNKLMLWFDAIEQHGFVEWNSAPYYPVDLIGLFALYNVASHTIIKDRSKHLIDKIMLLNSLHYGAGLASGTMGRVYEKELLASPLTEHSAYGNVAWGGGYFNRKCASLPLFCLSDYEPPTETTQYANWNKDSSLLAYYIQGGAKITAYKSKGVAISSILITEENGASQKGHQEHVLDIQFTSHSNARVWINHPGDTVLASEKRPSFWAGSLYLPYLAQYQNTLLALFNLPKDDVEIINFTHLYLPENALDKVIKNDHSLFIKAGEASLAILSLEKLEYLDGEARQNGSTTAWYLSSSVENNFDAFIASYTNKTLELTSSGLAINDPKHGSLLLTKNGLVVDGKKQNFVARIGEDPIIQEVK